MAETEEAMRPVPPTDPMREDVRTVACPVCHASAGSPCYDVGRSGLDRNHRARLLVYLNGPDRR
jgi:hypothetical protein